MAEGRARTVTVAANVAGIRAALDELGRFCEAQAIPDEVRRRLTVALDEVLSNVARHGRPEDGKMQVRFSLTGDVLTVRVEDSAPAFNPLNAPVPDTTSAIAYRKIGGLGIAVTKGLLEDVAYERADGRNRVTLVVRVSRTAEHS